MAKTPPEPDPGKNGHRNGRSERPGNDARVNPDLDPVTKKFVKGNKAAVGHRGPRHRQAFQRAISEATMEEIAEKLVGQALENQPWAMQLVLRALVGKASESVATGDESEPQLEYL